MRRVIVESPYAANSLNTVERHVAYARACLADCLKRGEAPFASHLLYAQPGVLDDAIAEERSLGIKAGFAWRDVADATVVYGDLGMSWGMTQGIEDAQMKGRPVNYRMLGGEWSKS